MSTLFDGFYAKTYRTLLPFKVSKSTGPTNTLLQTLLDFHSRNPLREGHWEFLSTALLEVYDRGDDLDEPLRQALMQVQPHLGQGHHAANWRLMQSLVKTRLRGYPVRFVDLLEARVFQETDGFIPDTAEDRSSQYHGYLLLLLTRFGEHSTTLESIITRGFQWLYETYHRFGDPSPLGRGRFQLFGYAAMAAAAHHARRWNIDIAPEWEIAVHQRLAPELPDGSLVSRWTGPHRSALLHGYNTTHDYRAFRDFWLQGIAPIPNSPSPAAGLWWHPLGSKGFGLVANEHGVQAALLPSQAFAIEERFGVRESLRAWLEAGRDVIHASYNRFRHPSPPPEPLPLLPGISHLLDGCRLQLECHSLSLRIASPADRGCLVFLTPSLWLRDDTSLLHWHTTGSVETEIQTWARPGLSPWVGRRARIVREGSVECLFSPFCAS